MLLPVLLLAACSSGGSEGDSNGNVALGDVATTGGGGGESGAGAQGGAISGLTGLYEGASGTPRNQMCIIPEGGQERFGLIVWGPALHSCAGSGTVTRVGDRLRLAMAGDSACTLEATVTGNSVKLPTLIPPGCRYYCGERATMGGAEFTQTGKGRADALRARDIVGDPLCGVSEG
jgi:hypothetical protein